MRMDDNCVMNTTIRTSHLIIWVIKSRKMRWTGHVARMGEKYVHGSGRN